MEEWIPYGKIPCYIEKQVCGYKIVNGCLDNIRPVCTGSYGENSQVFVSKYYDFIHFQEP